MAEARPCDKFWGNDDIQTLGTIVRLFVSEYVTGGAWPEEKIPQSLFREGKAMLSAFATDAARSGHCEVVTTWDIRLGTPSIDNVEVISADSPAQERFTFEKLVSECDGTFVIAPEFSGILAERCKLVSHLGGQLLGANVTAVELCADKLELAKHLDHHGIATIPTRRLTADTVISDDLYPVVIKPLDGAGSQDIFLVSNADDYNQIATELTRSVLPRCGIVQPFVPGEAISISAVVSENHIEVFPPGLQCLSNDGRFRYSGGQIPVGNIDTDQAGRLVSETCRSIPGLYGYVGFDLIRQEDNPDRLIVVEINPRLTTSYLGYRKITDENLTERILFPAHNSSPANWKSHTVMFGAEGNTRILSSTTFS